MPEPKQEIPIEIVEVSPNETQLPPKSSFRATKDSIAGGKALPKRPVSAVKPRIDAHKASSKSPSDLKALSPAEVFQPKLRPQKAESPNLSPQQPKPQTTKLASATIPPTTPPAPKVEPTAIASATIPPAPKPKKIALATTTPPAPKVEPTAIASATTPPAPKPKKIAVAPTTPPPALPRKTALATSPVPNPQNLGQRGTRLSGRTQPPAMPSKTGAASLLGGTMSVSSRNFSGDNLAALPNSNRDRQAPDGIDATSQDIDITSYLKELQQRVKQQWLPGVSQSSRRTVLNFSINRSGQLSNLQLAQTSGFSITDRAALSAVQRSAPFAPLPTGYPNKYIHIQFTFDINVYGELNLSGDGG
ncbi:MAG: TonB family protein [Aulosira sp. ZfuVER01]|nr:TonB family protein [Aulosira sp. ZfuVER01]MDZ7997410.1 TonB family protein [Aulosira sp. DedVER01a]MDZ8054561.1 TonB family protein [Aulosira sp. ZfuCHP01]